MSYLYCNGYNVSINFLEFSWIIKHLETEEELKVACCTLKEQEEAIDALKVKLSERETEIASIRKELEATSGELQKKVTLGWGTVKGNWRR
jgi:uncharacterized coiled-coil protein SlyX